MRVAASHHEKTKPYDNPSALTDLQGLSKGVGPLLAALVFIIHSTNMEGGFCNLGNDKTSEQNHQNKKHPSFSFLSLHLRNILIIFEIGKKDTLFPSVP